MTGIILFAHGSTVDSANNAVHAVSAELAKRTGRPVETAFLDCAPPTMADAMAAHVRNGIKQMQVIPYFLTTGIHLKRDLPRIVEGLSSIYPDVTVDISEPLDGHSALLDILVDRAKGA
jgi:sirohydrochlorin cobaltochelatase